jgi:hypothetical protein
MLYVGMSFTRNYFLQGIGLFIFQFIGWKDGLEIQFVNVLSRS